MLAMSHTCKLGQYETQSLEHCLKEALIDYFRLLINEILCYSRHPEVTAEWLQDPTCFLHLVRAQTSVRGTWTDSNCRYATQGNGAILINLGGWAEKEFRATICMLVAVTAKDAAATTCAHVEDVLHAKLNSQFCHCALFGGAYSMQPHHLRLCRPACIVMSFELSF